MPQGLLEPQELGEKHGRRSPSALWRGHRPASGEPGENTSHTVRVAQFAVTRSNSLGRGTPAHGPHGTVLTPGQQGPAELTLWRALSMTNVEAQSLSKSIFGNIRDCPARLIAVLMRIIGEGPTPEVRVTSKSESVGACAEASAGSWPQPWESRDRMAAPRGSSPELGPRPVQLPRQQCTCCLPSGWMAEFWDGLTTT